MPSLQELTPIDTLMFPEDILAAINLADTCLATINSGFNLTDDQVKMCTKNAQMSLSYIRGYVEAKRHE